MIISYAITVCNELTEFRNLIEFLLLHKREEDEIVVLQDTRRYTDIEKEICEYACEKAKDNNIRYYNGTFQEDFAAWKNTLTLFCKGDYIFQIDADECPNENMVKYLPSFLKENPEVDLYLVSRNNVVEGITQEDIERWHWSVSLSSNGKQLVNWPDWQTRIYKKELRWKGKVHERIVGHKQYAKVPTTLYLTHNKTIQKQREQNEYYNRIVRDK